MDPFVNIGAGRAAFRLSDLLEMTRLVKVLKREKLEEGEVLGRSRRGAVVQGRKVFCQVAVRKLGYSGASVARFLGVTTSAVNRMARQEDVTDLSGW